MESWAQTSLLCDIWVFRCQSKAGPVTDYVRGEDVLDIWFDSGASWAAVLEGTSVSRHVDLTGTKQVGQTFFISFLTPVSRSPN